MATGRTTSSSLADSLETIIDSARLVREYPGVMPRLVDRIKLDENTGLSWEEVDLQTLVAQSITETTTFDNPQQLTDTLRTITPTQTGVTTIITDRALRRISKMVTGKIGQLAQNAIERKKDQDLLAFLDGATTSLAGAGVTLTSGHISSAVSRVHQGGGNEPSVGEIFVVLHPFQLKDIQDEVTQGIGTYTVPEGISADYFRRGFNGTLFGANVFEDGLLTVDSADDSKGGVFAREAIVLVQGRDLTRKTKDLPEYGGGATQIFIYDEYGIGERSSGNWLYEIYSDALAPTS